MKLPNKAADWAEILPWVPAASTEHFDFYYIPREDSRSPANASLAMLDHGIHGVRAMHPPDLPTHYARVLEETYAWLTAVMKRPAPEGNERGRLPVLLYAMDDGFQPGVRRFPHVDQIPWEIVKASGTRSVRLLATICLPVRFDNPTLAGALRSAASTAAHELVHAFNMHQLPLVVKVAGGTESLNVGNSFWRWYNEGLAMLTESTMLTGNRDWLRFVKEWVDRPHISLNCQYSWYQAVMFLRYLHRLLQRHGKDAFVVWDYAETVLQRARTGQGRTETPEGGIGIVLRNLKPARLFAHADPNEEDVFSAYCVDAWFAGDPEHDGYEPEVYERFGPRAVAMVQRLESRIAFEFTLEAGLPSLSCLYFKFYLPATSGWLKIKIQANDVSAHKAFIVPAGSTAGGAAMDLKQRTPCRPITAVDHAVPEILKGEWHTAQTRSASPDHVVVVMVNCSLNETGSAPALRATFFEDDLTPD